MHLLLIETARGLSEFILISKYYLGFLLVSCPSRMKRILTLMASRKLNHLKTTKQLWTENWSQSQKPNLSAWLTPATSNLKIDSSAYSISPSKLPIQKESRSKVWIEIKFENEKYASYRATKTVICNLNVINLQEANYKWRVKAKNKKNKKTRSSAISFFVIRTWFYYWGRKWKAYSTFIISDLTLYYSLLFYNRNSKQQRGPRFDANWFSNIEQQIQVWSARRLQQKRSFEYNICLDLKSTSGKIESS